MSIVFMTAPIPSDKTMGRRIQGQPSGFGSSLWTPTAQVYSYTLSGGGVIMVPTVVTGPSYTGVTAIPTKVPDVQALQSQGFQQAAQSFYASGLTGTLSGTTSVNALTLPAPALSGASFEAPNPAPPALVAPVPIVAGAILSIIVQELAGNAVTGGVSVGTSSAGTQIAASVAVAANAVVSIPLTASGAGFSAATSIWITPLSAGNNANLAVTVEWSLY